MVNPTISGDKTWTLPIDELVIEATERVGGKWQSAEEMDSAIRSLNLVLKDLMNRGKPLFTVVQKTLQLSVSTASYSLSVGIQQVLGPVLRVSSAGTGPTDIPINRVGFLDFNNIARKETLGQPSLYTVEQQRENVLLRIWPTPTSEASGWSLVYYGVEAPDAVTQLFQNPDVNRRYLTVITAGLTYYMSLKKPEIPMDRIMFFKQEFEQQIVLAFGEDREQVSHIVRPATGWYR